MKYNMKRHLDLLRYSQKLKEEGKSIFDNSKKDFFELREYNAMLSEHLQWENRTQYFELIENLLNGPIHFLDLREKYRAIDSAVKRLEAELILFEPDDRSKDFEDPISEIVTLFDRYCPDPTIREDYELSEEELKNVIQTIFIEMKDRYP